MIPSVAPLAALSMCNVLFIPLATSSSLIPVEGSAAVVGCGVVGASVGPSVGASVGAGVVTSSGTFVMNLASVIVNAPFPFVLWKWNALTPDADKSTPVFSKSITTVCAVSVGAGTNVSSVVLNVP